MSGKSNAQLSEPQRADLNMHANLPTIRHTHCKVAYGIFLEGGKILHGAHKNFYPLLLKVHISH